MLQVRKNEISLRNSSGGSVFAPLSGNNADDEVQLDIRKTLSFLNYKENAPCYGNNNKKGFVGSSNQVY